MRIKLWTTGGHVIEGDVLNDIAVDSNLRDEVGTISVTQPATREVEVFVRVASVVAWAWGDDA